MQVVLEVSFIADEDCMGVSNDSLLPQPRVFPARTLIWAVSTQCASEFE